MIVTDVSGGTIALCSTPQRIHRLIIKNLPLFWLHTNTDMYCMLNCICAYMFVYAFIKLLTAADFFSATEELRRFLVWFYCHTHVCDWERERRWIWIYGIHYTVYTHIDLNVPHSEIESRGYRRGPFLRDKQQKKDKLEKNYNTTSLESFMFTSCFCPSEMQRWFTATCNSIKYECDFFLVFTMELWDELFQSPVVLEE